MKCFILSFLFLVFFFAKNKGNKEEPIEETKVSTPVETVEIVNC